MISDSEFLQVLSLESKTVALFFIQKEKIHDKYIYVNLHVSFNF